MCEIDSSAKKINIEITPMMWQQLFVHQPGGSMKRPTHFASGTSNLEQGVSPIGPYLNSCSSENSHPGWNFSVTCHIQGFALPVA